MRTARSRILCVDDDPVAVEWIRRALDSSKIIIEFTSLEGGRAALKLLYREAFDLCIFDYALPDMTGVQLCYLMRRIGYTVPIMIFTALNRRIDREKATAAGANEFLSKPDDLDAFSESVRRLLRVRRLINTKNETIATLTTA